MKHVQLYLVLFIFLSISLIHAEEYRTFVGSNGKKIEAILLNFDSDTEIVKIRLKNGKEQNVKLSLFSSKDQQWIKNQGKGDNPFGDEPAPKPTSAKPSKPLDMKFVYDEAKEAMDQFEKEYKNSIIGPIPSMYADYALIQGHVGQDIEAKKTIEKARKLADSIPAYTHNSWNYVWIVKRAIIIGSKEIAQKVVEDGQVSDFDLPRCYAWLENDTNAVLEVAKIANNVRKAFAYAHLGGEYLTLGKTDKAKEVFAITDSLVENQWTWYWISDYWLKSNYPEKEVEAKKYIDKMQWDNVKARALRNLAVHYIITKDEENTKKYIAEALIKATKAPEMQSSVIYLFFINNNLPTYRKVRNDLINEIEQKRLKANDPVVMLSEILFQEMLVDGTPKFDEVVKRVETLNSSINNSNDSDKSATMYLSLLKNAVVFGETKYIPEMTDKAERHINQMNDDNKKAEKVQELQILKNSAVYWLGDEISVGFPALIASGQSDRILPILDRIKSPSAKIFALRVIAEELDKLKK